MQEVQDSGMLYRSSDCILSRRLEKTSLSHLDGKYSDFDERFSHLDGKYSHLVGKFSDFVTRKGHVFMSHRYHGFHRYFFEHESHEKGEVASLLRNYKFSNIFSRNFERSDPKQ